MTDDFHVEQTTQDQAAYLMARVIAQHGEDNVSTTFITDVELTKALRDLSKELDVQIHGRLRTNTRFAPALAALFFIDTCRRYGNDPRTVLEETIIE